MMIVGGAARDGGIRAAACRDRDRVSVVVLGLCSRRGFRVPVAVAMALAGFSRSFMATHTAPRCRDRFRVLITPAGLCWRRRCCTRSGSLGPGAGKPGRCSARHAPRRRKRDGPGRGRHPGGLSVFPEISKTDNRHDPSWPGLTHGYPVSANWVSGHHVEFTPAGPISAASVPGPRAGSVILSPPLARAAETWVPAFAGTRHSERAEKVSVTVASDILSHSQISKPHSRGLEPGHPGRDPRVRPADDDPRYGAVEIPLQPPHFQSRTSGMSSPCSAMYACARRACRAAPA